MKKEQSIKQIIQVMEYKGIRRPTMIAELIDAISYLMESDTVLVIDEEGSGGCTSLFLGTKNVSDQVCDYLDEIEVPYTLMARTKEDEGMN